MRRMDNLFGIFLLCLFLSGCGKQEVQGVDIEPEITQMKSICELATMDCYFHNVAKYTEEDVAGALWWKKDMCFWIEYSGIVSVGIDASLVTMKIKGDTVTITIPPAKVLGCKVDETSLTEDSYIYDKDSVKGEVEYEVMAFDVAQENMKMLASNDTVLLANAQQRAQSLLEDYVVNIGDSIGKEYKIKWVYTE